MRRDAESKAGDTDLRKTPHPGVKSQPFSSGEESENAGVEIWSDAPKPENKKSQPSSTGAAKERRRTSAVSGTKADEERCSDRAFFTVSQIAHGPTFPKDSIVFNRPSTIDLPICKSDIFYDLSKPKDESAFDEEGRDRRGRGRRVDRKGEEQKRRSNETGITPMKNRRQHQGGETRSQKPGTRI
ncbi:hypothetical protein F2Q70_00033806 [Brassica cretica]|uniref:Uncharacterized protein n=1 Tax=Brassica cretica TaxID=69181 RepID=A0A8S9JT93_BRACR|nr:hypothetical protein F2Q70_00033806 [Brassica cretica]